MRPIKELLGVLVIAGLSLAAWWAWLGWDTEYQVDPVTGNSSGPYEPFQVIGCVLTLGVMAVAGGLVLRPLSVVAAMTVSFTAAWAISAAASDESGLWPVGAVLVAGGMVAGTAACSFGARWTRRAARSDGQPGSAAV